MTAWVLSTMRRKCANVPEPTMSKFDHHAVKTLHARLRDLAPRTATGSNRTRFGQAHATGGVPKEVLVVPPDEKGRHDPQIGSHDTLPG